MAEPSLPTNPASHLPIAGTISIDGTSSSLVVGHAFINIGTDAVPVLAPAPPSAVTNTGTLQLINGGTLDLINLAVTNIGGTVSLVDSTSTAELNNTTINNGIIDNHGLLKATVGANAIHAADSITNHPGATLKVDSLGTAGVTLTIDNANAAAFTNQGELLATGKGELFLINDTVANSGGTVEVDANSILDLQTTTINNGTFVNSGLLEATVGANTIHAADSITNHAGATLEVDSLGTAGVTLTIDNASPTQFTNEGKLLATGKGELFLINDTVANSTGTVQVDANSILDLQTVTINNGTFVNFGLFEATVGVNTIQAADSITNHTGATLKASGSGVELQIKSATNFNNDGTLLATLGGTLDLDSLTVTNSAAWFRPITVRRLNSSTTPSPAARSSCSPPARRRSCRSRAR